MANIIVRCPRCGFENEVEDGKESFFCTECGKKIVMQDAEKAPAVTEPEAAPAETPAPAQPETEPVPEEAPVLTQPEVPEPAPAEAPELAPLVVPELTPPPADTASVPAPTGFAAELDKLFRSRKFEEAYEGYTRYLQAYPGDIRSLYRQGITAVYLSEGSIFRTAELRNAVGAAVSAMTKANDFSLAPEKDEDLIEMLLFMTSHGVSFNDRLGSREDCASQMNGWVALAGLYLEAAPLITSETRREEALKAGVELCDRALGFKSEYFVSSKQNSKGKTVEEYENYVPEKKQRSVLKDARRRMAESYNTLSTRTSEETRLNEDAAATEKTISRLKSVIRRTKEKYDASRKIFLLDNPEVQKGRNKILRTSLIIAGVVILALAVFSFFILKKQRTFLFILVALLAAAFLYVTFRISRKSMKEYEAGCYPEELKALYDQLENSKKELKENRKHSSAAKDAVKKFNRSKL